MEITPTRYSIIIPIRNEAPSLQELTDRLSAVLGAAGGSYEIIFVDDGSTDGGFDRLRILAASHPELRAVRLRRSFGKSAALAAGLDLARGEIIVTIDGDLQDPPEEIPKLIAALENADLVVGWKRERRDGLVKRLSSRIFNFLVSTLSGLKLHDINCGLKAFRRAVATDLDLYGDRHRFLPVLAHERGFRVVEVIVKHDPRRYGRSNYGRWGLRRFMNFFLDPLNLVLNTTYAAKPAHFFGGAGMALLFLGLGISLYLTVRWFLGYSIGNRPLFFLGILLIIVSIQLISLGFLGEMIVARRDKNRKPYAIEDKTF